MSEDASTAGAGAPGEQEKVPASPFALRRVAPATEAERLRREEGMARALKVGAAPYRDGEGKARYVLFKEANNAPVEAWRRDPRAKRGYRRTREARKAAGQLIGQPGDMIEIAKRLGTLHYQEGSDVEGAAARGLHDVIWSREHVYDTFTVPRRYGLDLMETGRIAAVAEEEARRLQAEDPKARGGFWVRDRKNLGLIYVVPNADPEAEAEEIAGGGGEDVLIGEADADVEPKPVELERTGAQPAAEAASAAEDGTPPKLNYPDIPLPTLEPTWEAPKGEEAKLPLINMEQDRIENIVAGKPARFEIADSSTANGDEPEHASHSYGYWAVWIYQDIIKYEAKRQGVDPDLVRAMVYVENAQGWYGHLFEAFRVAKTIFPMNINPKTWGRLVGVYGDFYDPIVNIRAGVALIRRLQERIANPTVAKVASPFKFTGRELVSDYGARVAQVYAARAWEREPIPDVYPEMDKPPDWAPEVSGYRRRREELKKQLKEEQTPRHILDEPFWTDASP